MCIFNLAGNPTGNTAGNTILDCLQQRALHQPEQVAYTFLVDGERAAVELTYQSLHRRAQAIAAHLQQHYQQRCASGARALLLYPPGLDYIEAFFGCLYAGIIAVPAYLPRPNRSLEKLERIAQNAQLSLTLTTANTLPQLTRQISPSSVLTRCEWVATDEISTDITATDITATDISATNRSRLDWQPHNISSDAIAFLQYTSGSTADPKGVMITHQNLQHNLSLISQGFAATPQSCGVIWLPPYHDMGLIGGILQPLYGGFPVILMSPLMFLQSPFRWLQAISRYRATISGGPNFAYDLCVRKITPQQKESLDLSSWQVAFNGAEPISPQVLQAFASAFESCGFRSEAFYPCYGLAESTLMAAGGKAKAKPVVRSFQGHETETNETKNNLRPSGRPLVGCGQAVSDGQAASQSLKVVNPQTQRQCQAREIGEIWLSGPSVAKGYWQQPENTQHTFQAYLSDTGEGPFLRTGDLGLLDEDGELFITGRLKDLMIVNGRNHYPQDIERTVVENAPEIRPHGCAVFAVEVDGTEKVVVAAELERQYWQRWKKAKVMLQNLTKRIASNITKEHMLSVETILWLKPGRLPKTSSGKVQRYLCQEQFLQGTLDTTMHQL